MSAVAHPSPQARSTNGGASARRAVIRWAGRMFRREWRQQLLVVALLVVAVAVAVGSVSVLHSTDPSTNSELGTANEALSFDASDPAKLEAGLDRVRKTFGTIDVIGHRLVAVPGTFEKVDFRA